MKCIKHNLVINTSAYVSSQFASILHGSCIHGLKSLESLYPSYHIGPAPNFAYVLFD